MDIDENVLEEGSENLNNYDKNADVESEKMDESIANISMEESQETFFKLLRILAGGEGGSLF